MFSLANKVIILTGGAGLYGRGLTSDIARAGATVIIASRDVAALARVAKEETDAGRCVDLHEYDQGSEDSILRLRDDVLKKYKRIDGLVNNAVARPFKTADAPLADWEASMKINSTGLFAVTRAIGDVMAGQGGGSIVNIASIQGMVGPDNTLYEGLDMRAIPDYFFHKAGMINLTRFFAAQYGPRGVRVNCLSPGGFLSGQPQTFVGRYERATFLRRMADPQDLGGPVIFMLSEASRYVTGANLAVDGGYTAH